MSNLAKVHSIAAPKWVANGRWNRVVAPLLLSQAELLKLFAMILILAPFFGLLGVIFPLFMHILSIQRVGGDSAEKHGISTLSSSRLGGVSIAVIMFAYVVYNAVGGVEMPFNATEGFGWVAVILMAFIGLSEDLKADLLSPSNRLSAQIVIMGVALFVADAYVPDSINLPVIDYLLIIPMLGWLLCTLFAVGFVNAFNMADGANGLIPGIAFAAFFVFASETGRIFEVGYMSACAIFLVFNVISGRFFLGDMGSYGLGAAIALYGLRFVSEGTFSASFLACLLAYPCLDLLMSIFRRLREGRSPFSPDNEHLHNRLFRQMRRCVDRPVLANSLTGLCLSGFTSGIALIGYLQTWWPLSSNGWLFLFILQVVLYLSAYWLTGLVGKSGAVR